MNNPSQRPPQSYQNQGPPEGWNDCPIRPSTVIKPKRRPVHLSHLDLLKSTSTNTTSTSTTTTTATATATTLKTPPTPPKLSK